MHTEYDALLPLHRATVLHSIDVVSEATLDDLDEPTPCAGWNLLDLLAHMTVQHRGFAAAARGFGSDMSHWDVATAIGPVATDPAGGYAAAALDVLDAFADATGDTPFALPEFGPDVVAPGAMAIGFHLVDYVVHGWDVAVTLGRPFSPHADIVSAALPLGLQVPDGEFRDDDGAPFARAVDGSAATDLDRLLHHLGRDPDWAVSRTRR